MNHVSQSLIIDKPYKNINLQLSPISATVHGLIAIVIIARFQQFLPEVIDHIVILVGLKGLVSEGLAI